MADCAALNPPLENRCLVWPCGPRRLVSGTSTIHHGWSSDPTRLVGDEVSKGGEPTPRLVVRSTVERRFTTAADEPLTDREIRRL
jgi:hypothetical protein